VADDFKWLRALIREVAAVAGDPGVTTSWHLAGHDAAGIG
jgi:hypothetical protein